MRDFEKKLFAQLDDEMPGVRANALEALREHLKKQGRTGRTFRDLVADLEKRGSQAPRARQSVSRVIGNG